MIEWSDARTPGFGDAGRCCGRLQLGDEDTTATAVKAALFAAEGYVFVSVNYRLAAAGNDVRWPAFGNDVAAAGAWLVKHADEVGIDPDRIALMGHSAGAHLVSIVGTNPDLLDEFGVQRDRFGCIVSLDTDLFDLDTPAQMNRELVATAFDGDNALLVDGSPFDQVGEHVDDGPLPQFLIVTRGSAGRISRTEAFGDAITTAGGDSTVVDVSPYDHRDVNVRLGEPGEEMVTAPVTEFLADCLR